MRITPTIIDFETKGIVSRPDYPPIPTGVSIKRRGERAARYWSWGHPTNNNCTKAQAQAVLKDIWRSDEPVLCHHAKFDVDVAQTHMGCGKIDWSRIHDSMFLLYLNNPHAKQFQLKPSADELFHLPPDERDAVRDWLAQHKIIRRGAKRFGEFIHMAPGDVVGRYANGDIMRTERIFNFLYPVICKTGMQAAYDRERELMPILLENERQGMRVNLRKLTRDIVMYEAAMAKADAWLRKRLHDKNLNIDADEDLAEALERNKIVTEWELTEKGQRSVSKKNLKPAQFHDARVASVLGYRNRLATCLATFMRSWRDQSRESGGLIYTNWNQVRQNNYANDAKGTRTGRLSSNPNFQNIPKNWYDKDDGYVHPKFLNVPELPNVREYVLPDEGGVFCHRDYNQQELRITAHFESGPLKQQYLKNPKLDVHDYVKGLIFENAGRDLERRAVKVMNFGVIYGRGRPATAEALNCSIEEAAKLLKAHGQGLPGVKELSADLKEMGRDGEAIRTWGRRMYFTEPPKEIDGRKRSFEYKLLNYLVQGSAADCTKQAIIDLHKVKRESRFLVTVHDEINISAPKGTEKKEMKILREAMEGVKFDIPMVTDGKVGSNWGHLKTWKDAA